MSTRILIADHHEVIVYGLKAILCQLPDVEISAFGDGIEALRNIRKFTPDIAVLEAALPLMSGLDILAAIKSEKLSTRVVLLAEEFEDSVLRNAFNRGAFGLIQGDESEANIQACITQVSKGLNWMSPRLQNVLMASGNLKVKVNEFSSLLNGLTFREREVADMVRLGLSNRQIARKLNVTEGTIKIHLHNIFRKTGVPNRTTLTAKIAYDRR